MRGSLAGFLGVLALVIGLAAAAVQCQNHARAQALARSQRECEMFEAALVELELRVSSHVPGGRVLATAARVLEYPSPEPGWIDQ